MTRTSRSDRRLRAATLTLLVGLQGCAYTARLLSVPDGATVLLPDGSRVVTPAEATFHPGRHEVVRIEAEGYRPLAVDMKRTEGQPIRWLEAAITQRGRREITFLLVEEHGPIGADDASSPAR